MTFAEALGRLVREHTVAGLTKGEALDTFAAAVAGVINMSPEPGLRERLIVDFTDILREFVVGTPSLRHEGRLQ